MQGLLQQCKKGQNMPLKELRKIGQQERRKIGQQERRRFGVDESPGTAESYHHPTR